MIFRNLFAQQKPTVHDVRQLIKSLQHGSVPVDSLDSSPEALTVKAVFADKSEHKNSETRWEDWRRAMIISQ